MNTKNDNCIGCKHSLIGACDCTKKCTHNLYYEERFSMKHKIKSIPRKSKRKKQLVE